MEKDNKKIIGILIVFIIILILFFFLQANPQITGFFTGQTTTTLDDKPITNGGVILIGGPSAGNAIDPKDFTCADTNFCFWNTTFNNLYATLDTNFELRWELSGNNTIHTHNQYLLIADYVDSNCEVSGSCVDVVYDGDNVSRLLNDVGYVVIETDPVFNAWLLGYAATSDSNVWTEGVLASNNSFLIDINAGGNSIFNVYDVNAVNLHSANAISAAYLCDNFGVACLDMTGSPWWFSGEFRWGDNVWFDENIYPFISLYSDIGSGAKRWNNLFVRNINAENAEFTGDVNSIAFYQNGEEVCDASGNCSFGSYADANVSNYILNTYGDLNMDLNYLQTGDNVSELNNDAGYITSYTDTNFETAGYDFADYYLNSNPSGFISSCLDTNAETACDVNQFLDGSGVCVDRSSISPDLSSYLSSSGNLTAGRIPYVSASKVLADTQNLTWNDTNSQVTIRRDDIRGAQSNGYGLYLYNATNAGTPPGTSVQLSPPIVFRSHYQTGTSTFSEAIMRIYGGGYPIGGGQGYIKIDGAVDGGGFSSPVSFFSNGAVLFGNVTGQPAANSLATRYAYGSGGISNAFDFENTSYGTLGTGLGINFKQWNGTGPGPVYARAFGNIGYVTEQNWTPTGSTQDSSFYVKTGTGGSLSAYQFMVNSDGDAIITKDNASLLLGAGQDASITYDGTNLVVNPKEVGSGLVSVQGDLNVSETIQAQDYYSGDGTQGYTGTCASGTTLTVKDGLITGCA